MGNDDKPQKKPLNLNADIPGGTGDPDTFAELDRASKRGGLLGRMNAAFHDALQSGRGGEEGADIRQAPPRATADDLAIRRAKHTSPRKMVVPEGVVIAGSMSSGSETEISGRVEGDVIVDGRLYLGPTALITGNVRATSCKVEGLIEGKIECSQEIDLGPHGRLNADAMAGKKITVAGQVFGSITAGGLLRLVASGRIDGDVHAKRLVIEEGASFNGGCTMRTPAQRQGA
ncbi:MAG: hypothetical protein GWP08_16080 [Nitrospiraceae bacterium]|nr:hypothetical protein [Nitrospiraceae bacterium]